MNKIVKWLLKPKYVILFLQQHQETLHVIKRKELKKMKDLVKVGQQETFHLSKSNPSYVNQNIWYYFINYETMVQYTFSQIESTINPNALDNIVSNHVIRDLTKAVMDTTRQKIMYFAIGCIIGVLTGLLIMDMLKEQKIQELYEKLQNSNPIIFEMVKGFMLI